MPNAKPISDSPAPWWRRGIVYQVYVRSFADGNGDGFGDIAGLRSRLSHLEDLGVDAVWINPWYTSPMHDGGYDVADYRDINPVFGTVPEAEAFIADAHERNIRVIVDLVPNHTSSEHVWFQEALAAGPGSAERARYHFRAGSGPDGNLPPNDWRSVFGGPAWTQIDDGSWYLHLFDSSQPDLDWTNPDVVEEFLAIFRFWLDRGADGFRIDVAHGLVKDPTYPDVGEVTDLLQGFKGKDHPHWDRDDLHPIIREWRAVLDEYDDRMMVAEAWVPADRLPLYLRPDEYHQSFNFDLLAAEWQAAEFTETIDRATKAAADVGAAPTWVLSNHDVMRHASRYGLPVATDWRRWPVDGPVDALDPALGLRRARAAALISLSLPGSTYVYQGEELGLPEVWDLPGEVLDDPVWERSHNTQKGRDGCRVPIPWEATGPSFGFGDAAPWLPQPAEFGVLSAASQRNDEASMLALYQEAIELRRSLLTGDEDITMIDLGPDVVAYQRGSGVRCVVNMGTTSIPLPAGEVLVASAPVTDTLPPDVGVWIR